MSKKDIRALVLADDCNPEWPSLPVVGYKTIRALSQCADVTVATHVRNRPNIDAIGLGGAGVEYVDNEYVAAPLFKLGTWLRGGDAVGWTTNIALSYPAYLAFEWEVWRRFGERLEGGHFDIVHRLTPMSPTLPSPMARVCPVPFILGPLNGGLRWPESYTQERDREKEWLVKVREAYRYLPFHRSTLDHSVAILAAFDHTRADLPRSVRERTFNFPEVGVDPILFSGEVEREARSTLRFLFVGRLVPYKLPSLVVECFADSPHLRRHRLSIVGDGPERESVRRLIADRGLESCVQLLDWRTQAEVGALMRESDVFVFPSIRELGAGVVAEAMASGLCCVAADYGGPAQLLGEGRGIKVPLGPRAQLKDSFRAALESLVADPGRVAKLGGVARDYALRELSWDTKGRRLVEIYRWALGRRSEMPWFYETGGWPERAPSSLS